MAQIPFHNLLWNLGQKINPSTVPVRPESRYPSKEELRKLPLTTLQQMRDEPGANQELLGPIDHRVAMRGIVSENPWMALPMAAAVPGYSISKALGFERSRSPASSREITEAYGGIYEGLKGLSR